MKAKATFLVLVQKASSMLNRQALASWLYTVAYRSSLEAKIRNTRRQRRERYVAMHRPETIVPAPQDWGPLLDQELNRLPEKYRAPIVLCDLQGRPRREAARQLRLAEGTLSSRLATGRRLLAQRLTRRGVTLSGGALAMSLSEASASVTPSLVGMTTKAALLVVVGKTTALSTSVSVLMKGAIQSMFLGKLKVGLTTVVALVFTAGTVVYCASGQTGTAAKPQGELEALRHENELLKINLRVTLEKIKALESEVGQLKSQAKAVADFAKDGIVDLIVGNETLFRAKGDGTVIDLGAAKKALERPAEMEAALKLLRSAKDAPSRQKALDQMERAMKKLREEIRPADKKGN